jgi:hypothetical protein
MTCVSMAVGGSSVIRRGQATTPRNRSAGRYQSWSPRCCGGRADGRSHSGAGSGHCELEQPVIAARPPVNSDGDRKRTRPPAGRDRHAAGNPKWRWRRVGGVSRTRHADRRAWHLGRRRRGGRCPAGAAAYGAPDATAARTKAKAPRLSADQLAAAIAAQRRSSIRTGQMLLALTSAGIDQSPRSELNRPPKPPSGLHECRARRLPQRRLQLSHQIGQSPWPARQR